MALYLEKKNMNFINIAYGMNLLYARRKQKEYKKKILK